MKIAIMQPKLLPYIGYWQLIRAVDTFVIFDDVNFVKKSYINHNSILINHRANQFTLEIIGASQNKLINELSIGNNSLKILKMISHNYKKAPNFKIIYPILEEIFNYGEKNLVNFIKFSFNKIMDFLEIQTTFINSSDIKKNNNLRAEDKIIEICKILNAKQYINAIGGKHLYTKKKFETENISLSFLETQLVEYRQFNNNFISHLSIIDVLMHNNKTETNKMLNNYKLI